MQAEWIKPDLFLTKSGENGAQISNQVEFVAPAIKLNLNVRKQCFLKNNKPY